MLSRLLLDFSMTSHEGAALSSPPPRQPPVWAGFFDESARVRSLHPVREIARLTHGAYCRFDPGAARQLAELLRAVAVFAHRRTDSARRPAQCQRGQAAEPAEVGGSVAPRQQHRGTYFTEM